MGKKVVIKKHKKRSGIALFFAGGTFLMMVLGLVWIVQFQAAYKQGIFGNFKQEWEALAADIKEARELSQSIESETSTEFLELNLLPSFALENRDTQIELATSIEAEMTKRRFGTLPIAADRVTEAPAETEELQEIETN